MSTHDQSGLGTPPVGGQAYQGPHFVGGGQSGAYVPHDYPPPGQHAPDPQQAFPFAGYPAPDAASTSSATVTRPHRRRFGTLVAAASLSAVIGAGAGVGSYAYLSGDGTTSTTSPISVTTVPASQNPPLNGTVTATAAKIEPSVVTITVASGNSGDIGSGVVLDSQGHILTNNHVVEAASGGGQSGSGADSTITVTFHNGTTAKATVVGTSVTNDLAVIKVNNVAGLVPAVFAKSSSLQVGQTVVAAGAPLGLSESVTSGIVSNTARPVRSGSNDDAVYLAVQTDAAINPGNSGGPLVNLNAAVVGINSSIASTGSSSAGSSQSGNIGIGFAIPADVAVRVASDLIANGTSVNAALGVRVSGGDSSLSTTTGVALESVTPGGAAAKMGLLAGDVVTKVNDFATTTPDGLIAATRFYAPGTTVNVTYTRDGGSPQTVKVTLGHS